MVYEEVNPEIWTPKEDGDFIEGVLINTEKDIGENKSNMYTIESQIENKSVMKNVWGSTILDYRMTLISIGSKIKITYKGLGEKKGGKNPPKIFKVEVDKD